MRTLVIGVGNLLRCDDGAGIHVVRRLREIKPELDVLEVSLPSVDIIEEVRGYDRVIVVDAIISGGEPGTVFNVNLHQGEEPPVLSSSHGMDLFTTLKLGMQLYEDMPGEQIVIGIEASNITTFSEECTPKVEEAVRKVVEIIMQLV